MTLYFYMSKVQGLFKQSQSATERIGVFDLMHSSESTLKSNPAIPPGLILVKEETIYLLSNGKLADGSFPKNSLYVGHALGFNPAWNPEQKAQMCSEVGKGDFAQFLSLEWLGQEIVTRRNGFFYVTFTQGEIEMGWVNSRSAI